MAVVSTYYSDYQSKRWWRITGIWRALKFIIKHKRFVLVTMDYEEGNDGYFSYEAENYWSGLTEQAVEVVLSDLLEIHRKSISIIDEANNLLNNSEN